MKEPIQVIVTSYDCSNHIDGFSSQNQSSEHRNQVQPQIFYPKKQYSIDYMFKKLPLWEYTEFA